MISSPKRAPKLGTSLLLSTVTGLPIPYKTHENKRPPPISTLPTEILIQILKHLISPGDLHNCVLVSRRWCECAVELLWCKPSFPDNGTMACLLRRRNQTFTYLRFIRQLDLEDIGDVVLSTFSRCECLERLNLFGCKHLTGEGLAQALPHFTNLVAIDLSGVLSTTSKSIIGLANVATQLQDINLSHCTKVTDDAVLALATSCPLLSKVILKGLRLLTDDGISTLALACPMLLKLDLSYCELITDASVRLIWTHLIYMHELRLSHCSLLTDAAFPAPAESYVQLDDSNSFPTSSTTKNDDLSPLVISESFEHLWMLDLSDCSLITDNAIEGIVSHAAEICLLNIKGCVNFTAMPVRAEAICRRLSPSRYIQNLHFPHGSVFFLPDDRVLVMLVTYNR